MFPEVTGFNPFHNTLSRCNPRFDLSTQLTRGETTALKRGVKTWFRRSQLFSFLMMLFSTHDFLLPQVLWKEKREMFPKKSLQVRKNFTGRSYSLFPLPNTHTKKHFVVLLPAAIWAFEVSRSFELLTHAFKLHSGSASMACIWATCQNG